MLRIGEEAHRTDTGRQRQANEDAYFARAPVFAVADGMGGARAGEVASRIATDAFEPWQPAGGPPEERLKELVRAANRRIHEVAKEDNSRAGMGTTLTAALVGPDDVSIAHVGDSRAYVFRDDRLKRLTQDHSLVEELRRQGKLTEEEAESHPQRSIITRALGPEPDVEVDTMTYPAREGDVFLICSDGLTTMVEEEAIGEALRDSEGLDGAVATLVRQANELGGRDNITVVAFRIEEVEAEPDSAASAERTLMASEAEAEGLTAEAIRAAIRGKAGKETGAQGGDEPGQGPPAPPRPEASRESRPGRPAAAAAGGESRQATSALDAGARPSRRRRVFKALALVAIVAGIVGGAFLGVRQIYFLGVDEQGVVAVYRGLPYDLPLDVKLYSKHYVTAIPAASLPPDRSRRITDHTLRSRSDAVDIVTRMERNRGIRR